MKVWLLKAQVFLFFINADGAIRRHLGVLGLPAVTELETAVLREAYLRSVKVWHPDRHQGAGQAAAEEQFKRIQHSYQALCTFVTTNELPN